MGPVTIIDGGMGKELARIGAPFGQPEWSALALIEGPEWVLTAHRNFIAAGADVIITNTYAVVPYHLGEERFATSGRELAEVAARLAREAADQADRTVLVAGSLPPLFGSYQPERFEPDRAPGMYEVLVDAQRRYVDIWLGETIGSTDEARAVLDAIAQTPQPVWISFNVPDDVDRAGTVIRSGESIAAAAAAVADDCEAILFNCSVPEVMGPAISTLVEALRDTSPGIRVGAYANAFPAKEQDYAPNEVVLGRRDDLTSRRYTDLVGEWIDLGATIVGGCCGIHPEHIEVLVRRFR